MTDTEAALVAGIAEALCVASGHGELIAIPGSDDPRNRIAACYKCQRRAAALVASPAMQAERAAVWEEGHQRGLRDADLQDVADNPYASASAAAPDTDSDPARVAEEGS